MTCVRTLALAAAIVTVSAVAANAQGAWPSSQPQGQSAWPSSAPQPQSQSAWPSSGPQPQQQQQAAWPNNAPPAQPQQQAPWPANAPAGPPMAAPPMGGGFGGGGGGGFGGGPPPGGQQDCVAPFTALRTEVEKRGMAAKTASEKRASREEMCKLVTAYGDAEVKWIKYTESNMSKCGIPKELVTQLKTVHAKTADGQKKLCAAGPAVSAAPTLSDALGTATMPTRESEKRRSGGTLDTLTGNPLAR